MTRTESPVASVTRHRVALTAMAVVLVATDLIVKAWASRALADGQLIDLALLQLRLAYNPGVAFSLGATLPGWVVFTATAGITAALAAYTWRAARTVVATGGASAQAKYGDRDGCVAEEDYYRNGHEADGGPIQPA